MDRGEPTAERHISRWSPGADIVVLIALPTAVVILASYFLSLYGYPSGYLARPSIIDGHAEAAARLKVLATFVLLTALSLGALAYAAFQVPKLDAAAARSAIMCYAILVGAGLYLLSKGHPEEIQRFVGERFVCESLSGAPPDRLTVIRNPAAQAKAARPTRDPGPVVKARDPAHACTGARRARFETLRDLTNFQRVLLTLVVPALALGLIACGLPPPGAVTPEERERRAERMNGFLYVSAALLVAGLLHLSALLRWPAHSLHPDDLATYQDHVGSLVLYWGFTYSVYIAFCYVPAAANLAHRCPASREKPSAAFQPLQLLKTGAAIFAPAVTGLLGNVLTLKI